MISVNEYNRDNDEHDGAIFMTCLMDALTSMYCDAENRPAAGLHIHSLTSVFSEGAGPTMTALCVTQWVSGLIEEKDIEMPNIYACIKRHPDNRDFLQANDAAIDILIQSTKGSVTISEIPEVTSELNGITSFIARSST